MRPWKTGREYFLLVFLLVLPLVPSLFAVFKLPFIAYNNSSDTFLYLDIAKNLSQGRGFVVSFDNYLFWPGPFYPALPFVHCLWPLALSLLLPLFSSMSSLVLLNFILAVVNGIFVFKIMRDMTRDRVLGYCAAVILMASVCVEITIMRLLTEQLSLLVTLAALRIFTAGPKPTPGRSALTGLCLGLGFLIRSSSFFYPLAFALGLFFSRENKKDKFLFAVILLAVSLGFMGLWEIVIRIAYGVFYPQYPIAFQHFYLSAFIGGGQLTAGVPVLLPFETKTAVSFLGANILGALRALFAMLQMVIIFSVAGIVRIFWKEREKTGLTLSFLAIFQASSMVLFYPYIKLNDAELVRFLLVPVLVFLIIGLREFKNFCMVFFSRKGALFFAAMILILFAANMRQSLEVLDYYWKEAKTDKVRVFESLSAWVKQNTGHEELIAAEEYVYGSVYLDRPTVSFLERKLLNEKNLRSFTSIYRPRAIIIEKSSEKDRLLRQAGYEPVSINQKGLPFAVYESRIPRLAGSLPALTIQGESGIF